MTQHACQSHANVRMLKNSLPHHATLNHITILITTLMQTLKTNTTTGKHS